MVHDNKSTGLFSDEEEGYNLDEAKYKLKLDAPEPEVSADINIDKDIDLGGGDLGGLEDLGGEPSEKPFDDEPFDAEIEADETEEPEKYIQQLAGKLGQSLRSYTNDMGQPDFDLEKFAINSVISATHTSEMDSEDQKDIIKKVKSSGGEEDPEVDVNVDVNGGAENGEERDVNLDVDNDVDFDDEDIDERLNLESSNKNGIFVEESNLKGKIMEALSTIFMGEHHDTTPTDYGQVDNQEYVVDIDAAEPAPAKPTIKPDVAPTPTKTPRRNKPWKVPVIEPGTAPAPKAKA